MSQYHYYDGTTESTTVVGSFSFQRSISSSTVLLSGLKQTATAAQNGVQQNRAKYVYFLRQISCSQFPTIQYPQQIQHDHGQPYPMQKISTQLCLVKFSIQVQERRLHTRRYSHGNSKGLSITTAPYRTSGLRPDLWRSLSWQNTTIIRASNGHGKVY